MLYEAGQKSNKSIREKLCISSLICFLKFLPLHSSPTSCKTSFLRDYFLPCFTSIYSVKTATSMGWSEESIALKNYVAFKKYCHLNMKFQLQRIKGHIKNRTIICVGKITILNHLIFNRPNEHEPLWPMRIHSHVKYKVI